MGMLLRRHRRKLESESQIEQIETVSEDNLKDTTQVSKKLNKTVKQKSSTN